MGPGARSFTTALQTDRKSHKHPVTFVSGLSFHHHTLRDIFEFIHVKSNFYGSKIEPG